MLLTDRQEEILKLVRSEGRVLVEDLADRFAVSPQTVRTDLNKLSRRNKLMRIHGGAVPHGGNENFEYEARRQIAAMQKVAIGQAAAALIPNNASLFVNIGTTTEAVCNALIGHTDLMVITNNINVANRLRVHDSIEVVIAGGVVRKTDGGIVGEAAVDFIEQFKVDYAVIGASAIDGDGGLLDFDFREVKVAQAIIANARNVVLVADSTKFDRNAPVRIGRLSQVDVFVTDKVRDSHIREICESAEVELIETE